MKDAAVDMLTDVKDNALSYAGLYYAEVAALALPVEEAAIGAVAAASKFSGKLANFASKAMKLFKKADEAVEGGGNSAQIPRSGAEWNDYYKSKYGDGDVTWVTELKSYDDIQSNPKALWGKSADEVGRTLGDGWTRGTYGSAGTGWKFTNGDKSVFYHPGGGGHEGSYIGFSSGQTGKVKVIGSDYKALSGDKATIIQY
ncbi:MAG: transposase protein [Paenibacillus sp.]|jgi:hypothetical protein|nr:transposase protein [Paenibacillus sp.]